MGLKKNNINYKKLLEKYCGKSIFQSIEEWGDDIFRVNGERKNLVLNSWIIQPIGNFEFNELTNIFVKVFDIIYSYTDEADSGTIIDFEFNKVFIYYEEINNSIQTVKKINNDISLLENPKIKSFISLHIGETFLGNWGSSKRFKRMLFGSEVDYCEMINTIKFKDEITCVASQAYKDALKVEVSFKEIDEFGKITYLEKDKGKIYELIL